MGALAQEVVSSTDVGLPLGPAGTAALLPAGVSAFGQGLSVDEDEVRLFLALREAAHHRLFAHVPWLRARLLGAVEDYARGIAVDADALREAMPQIDPANPEALNEALSGAALFQPEDTEQQKAALARLETVLALVEGWVATVVDSAAGDRLPQAGALAEAIRRRRATGGPAERTFATLVGLELRPRRLREAAAIWRGLTDARGISGRDAIWAHPDLLPTADDFDDPDGFVHGRPGFDISDLESESSEQKPQPAAGGSEDSEPKGDDAKDGDASDSHSEGSEPKDGEAGDSHSEAASPRTANRPTAPEPRPPARRCHSPGHSPRASSPGGNSPWAIPAAFTQLRPPGGGGPGFWPPRRDARPITSGARAERAGNIHPQAVDGIMAGPPQCQRPGDLEFHS